MRIKERRDLKINELFIKEISHLEAVEFMGLAKILKASPYISKDGKFKDKEFTEIFKEVVENFSQLDLKKRKEILKIVKMANKEREKDKRG